MNERKKVILCYEKIIILIKSKAGLSLRQFEWEWKLVFVFVCKTIERDIEIIHINLDILIEREKKGVK